MSNTGTPKTLHQAILNGRMEPTSTAIIEEHVRDFLSQHFTRAMLTTDDEKVSAMLQALFDRITKKET